MTNVRNDVFRNYFNISNDCLSRQHAELHRRIKYVIEKRFKLFLADIKLHQPFNPARKLWNFFMIYTVLSIISVLFYFIFFLSRRLQVSLQLN